MTDTDRIAQMAREAGLHINGQTSEERRAACARFARLVAEDCAKVAYQQVAEGKAHNAHVAILARYSKDG